MTGRPPTRSGSGAAAAGPGPASQSARRAAPSAGPSLMTSRGEPRQIRARAGSSPRRAPADALLQFRGVGVRQPARVGNRHRQDGLDRGRPGGQDHDPVGEVDGLLHVVRDQEGRRTLAREDPPELEAHAKPRQGVQRREWLVHQENPRPDGERTRHLHTLEHATGELGRVCPLEPLQPHHGGVTVGDASRFVGRTAVEADHQVPPHRQPREHRALLRDHDTRGIRPEDGHPVGQHRAPIRLLEAGHEVQEGRLAAAGRSHHRDELALGHAQADVVEDDEAAPPGGEALGDAREDDLIAHSATAAPASPRGAG